MSKIMSGLAVLTIVQIGNGDNQSLIKRVLNIPNALAVFIDENSAYSLRFQ